jgi:hypothetical protein
LPASPPALPNWTKLWLNLTDLNLKIADRGWPACVSP